jgi:hypothetical protein
MRGLPALLGSVVIALAVGSPAFAGHGKGKGGGGGESMKGGLPALEDRVDADEAAIAALQGQNNWAVVDGATGALARFSPSVTGATHTGTGAYEVDFNKDVSGCAYVATLGDTGTTPPASGEINVAGATITPNGVIVQTFDKTGLTLTDASFHLLVSCP